VRAEITKAIEPLRKEGAIGHGLDTSVTLYAGKALARDLTALGTDLRALFIVSQFALKDLSEAPADAPTAQDTVELRIGVARADGKKCARCWIYSTELGTKPTFPDACPRCTEVLRQLQ
jgi:isoleucyl-tRNA synthetase